MSGTEKRIVQSITDAVKRLPDAKKNYFLGFAEGAAAMAQQLGGERQSPNEPPSQRKE